MLRFLVAVSLACMTLVAASPGHGEIDLHSGTPVYRCSATSFVFLDEKGALVSQSSNAPVLAAYGNILVDTASGIVRTGITTRNWTIVQTGSKANDFVAAAGPSAARSVTDFIRIRAAGENHAATFFLVGLTTIATGTCSVVN